MKILVVNAGSSSLKYQLFDMTSGDVLAKGICEKIGISAGSGSMLGVGFGVALFHILWYALRILSVDTNLQLVLIGALLLLSVILDIQRKKMEARRIAR